MTVIPVKLSRRARVRRFLSENEWVYSVVGLMVGLMLWPLIEQLQSLEGLEDYVRNLIPEATGIIFTVLIIDRLDSMREDRLIKEQLMRRLHSRYNPTALSAVEELRVLGILADGSLSNLNLRGSALQDANLYQADLSNSDLTNANLKNADLVEANLTGAKVSDEQFASCYIMLKAIMPDGKRYDGRYNLPGDYKLAIKWGRNPDDPESMASYYEISVDEYLKGQDWAKRNLEKARPLS